MSEAGDSIIADTSGSIRLEIPDDASSTATGMATETDTVSVTGPGTSQTTSAILKEVQMDKIKKPLAEFADDTSSTITTSDIFRPRQQMPKIGKTPVNVSTEGFYDVIVVGGGLSGLYAARCLAAEGLEVVVFEARDRVGGRTYTYRDRAYEYADLGAAYVGRCQTKVISLAKELGLDLHTLPVTGKILLCLRNRKFSYDVDAFPTNHPLVVMDLNHLYRTLDNFSEQVPIDAPWDAPKAEEWDAMSVYDFLLKTCWTELAGLVIGLGLRRIFAASSESVSFLQCLHMIHACGGTRALLGSTHGLLEMKIKGGASSLCEKMALQMADRVMTETTVGAILQKDDYVIVKAMNNNEYKAKRVIVALSPLVMKNIIFDPPISSEMKPLMDHIPGARNLKTVMFYSKAHWRVEGYRGEFSSEDGIVRFALEDTKFNGEHPALAGFVNAEAMQGLTREDRKLQIAKFYSEVFDNPDMRSPTAYLEKDWSDGDSQTYSGSCVFYNLPPGFLTQHRRLWGGALGRVHFAGTEAALTFPGHMEGALRAGDLAARKILDSFGVENRKRSEDLEEVPYVSRTWKERLLPSVTQFLILMGLVVLLLLVVIISIVVAKAVEHKANSGV